MEHPILVDGEDGPTSLDCSFSAAEIYRLPFVIHKRFCEQCDSQDLNFNTIRLDVDASGCCAVGQETLKLSAATVLLKVMELTRERHSY